MAEDPKKQAADAAKKAADAAKDKLKNNAATKAAGDVFNKVQAKTGIDQKKVDEWQKKWLGMPETRKKYEHLGDAPEVVGEELIAMTNDIVDFVQGQEGGKSHLFKSIKENIGGFLKHPIGYLKQKGKEGKKAVMEAKDTAMKKAGEAKDLAGKAADAAKKGADAAKGAADKAKDAAQKATDTAKKATK